MLSTEQATAREGNATELVAQALEAGWRHIDASLIYRNQNGTGIALKTSGIPRKEVSTSRPTWIRGSDSHVSFNFLLQLYITSKYDAINNRSVTEEIQTTLDQLQVEYLDLYLIHFPRAAVNGGGIRQVWKEMELVKAKGLARSIGISNYDTEDLLKEVLDVAEVLP